MSRSVVAPLSRLSPLLLLVALVASSVIRGPTALSVTAWQPSALSTTRLQSRRPWMTPTRARLPAPSLLDPAAVTVSTTALNVLAAPPPEETTNAFAASPSPLPELGEDGIYHIVNKEQHTAFLEANRDKLVVLKVFAPWCRACKGLEPKFLQIAHDEKYDNLPLVYAQLSIQHNKAFVQSIGVIALPTVQFYVGGALHDNFPCGPSKVPMLKRKLAQLVNDHVDPQTRQVKESSLQIADGEQVVEASETQPDATVASTTSPTAATAEAQPTASPALTLSEEERQQFRRNIPYFANMNIADFDQVMDRAKPLTFASGSIIMREGRHGRAFYAIQSGEVEICQRSLGADDPMATPSSYLGTVINRLGPGDWFGERALITGEPRAASIRATEDVMCWSFDKDDFPFSSALSGRTRVLDDLDTVNDKYGVDLSDMYMRGTQQQIRDATLSSQTRGSVNRPGLIRGVDTDEEEEEDQLAMDLGTVTEEASSSGLLKNNFAILNVLTRFQRIRHVSRCLDYIVRTHAVWGDEGIRKRRAMLVSRLSPAQRQEFSETFDLIDTSGDGQICVLELKRVISLIGETRSDDEVMAMIAKGQRQMDGQQQQPPKELSKQDFMGIMAEAEFYHLFRDIFSALDTNDSGFVKASELDRVLCGVRDLISDDRKSIIDVEDKEMLVDYESFSRMLLGSALI